MFEGKIQGFRYCGLKRGHVCGDLDKEPAVGRCEREFREEDRGRNKLEVPRNRKAGGGRVWQVMGRVVGVSITREFVWIELLFSFRLFVVVFETGSLLA